MKNTLKSVTVPDVYDDEFCKICTIGDDCPFRVSNPAWRACPRKQVSDKSVSKQYAWRNEMKALLIRNGARIRPIIGSGRGSPSEVKQMLKELQSEVKAERRELEYAISISNMPVERIDEETFKAGYQGHTHIVKKYAEGKPHKFWCFGCPGFLNYKHCRHVDAVKLFEKREDDAKQTHLGGTTQ